MIRVKCPQCAKVLGLKDEVAGKMAKCPACNATFKVPTTAKPAPKNAATPDPLEQEETQATNSYGDDINPYTFAADVGPKDKEAIRDDRVDEMVRTAQRDKKRNQAWEQIGTPSKLLKIITMIELIVTGLTFVYFLMGIVLYVHQLDQWELEGKKSSARPKYIWPLHDTYGRMHPGNAFFITLGVFIPSLLIAGLVMAGAEAMKKMESYGLAMTGAIVGCFTFLPVGLLCVLTLLRKPIQYEFGISELRKKGIYTEPEKEEEEELVDEEEEEDEEEDEEEEDEEEVKPVPAKKSKPKV